MNINKFFHLVRKIELCILAIAAGIAVIIGTVGVAFMIVRFALDHTFPNWHVVAESAIGLVTGSEVQTPARCTAASIAVAAPRFKLHRTNRAPSS